MIKTHKIRNMNFSFKKRSQFFSAKCLLDRLVRLETFTHFFFLYPIFSKLLYLQWKYKLLGSTTLASFLVVLCFFSSSIYYKDSYASISFKICEECLYNNICSKQWLLWKIINIQNCMSWCKWLSNKAYQAFSIDVLSKKL